MALSLVRFAPGELGVMASASAMRPEAARAAVPKARALLDGPMFGAACGGEGPGCLQYRLLDAKRGVDSPSRYPSRGSTLSIVAGRPVVLAGDEVLPGADVAVQCYPTLVWEGALGPASGADAVWRAALVLFADGGLGFAIRHGTIPAFASELLSAGARWAGYTDGGGSTSLWDGSSRAGHPSPRAVPAWLLAEPRGAGAGPWLAAAAGAAALGSAVLIALARR